MPPEDFWNWANLSRLLEGCYVAVSLALAARLLRNGMSRRYGVLTAFLAFSALTLIGFYFLPRRTNLYAQVYFALVPLNWGFYFALAYEAYRRALEDHPGIATAGRWVVSGGLVLAVLATSVTLLVDLSAGTQRFPVLFAVHVAERAVATTITLLLAVLTGFLLYFPVLLRRNSLLLVTGLTLYFLGKALLLLLRNLLGPATVEVLSTVNQGLNLVIVSLWFLRIAPEIPGPGGRRPTVPNEQAEEMLRRLGRLNEVLTRGPGR
ncbi:MAG: hypothetical protein IT164_07115 [Bryobacterales bacterium]|nr:hypothetical protein [Bryobacterales bacterium]